MHLLFFLWETKVGGKGSSYSSEPGFEGSNFLDVSSFKSVLFEYASCFNDALTPKCKITSKTSYFIHITS